MATLLDDWDISAEYLTSVVRDNPSLRGMILGYVAERKLWDVFESDERVTALRKDDDHDRRRKGDVVCTYRDHDFIIEVKSLQTNSISMRVADEWVKRMVKRGRRTVPNPEYARKWQEHRMSAPFKGVVQCDASDRRDVELRGGEIVNTTCLKVGEFDILAAGLFAFRERWEFGFALNSELERSQHRVYSEETRRQLLKSSQTAVWPLEAPFTDNPFDLMDRIIETRS